MLIWYAPIHQIPSQRQPYRHQTAKYSVITPPPYATPTSHPCIHSPPAKHFTNTTPYHSLLNSLTLLDSFFATATADADAEGASKLLLALFSPLTSLSPLPIPTAPPPPPPALAPALALLIPSNLPTIRSCTFLLLAHASAPRFIRTQAMTIQPMRRREGRGGRVVRSGVMPIWARIWRSAWLLSAC